uniref:G-protein coupled receptors family 1 profile domain-containing protein n=1 Tax=Gouania willdenowi TaxID=441366 RepID=A0A8C5DEX8_GOUWI
HLEDWYEFNETYITLGGFEGMENYRYLYFILVLTLCILSIYSNAIIVYIIWEHQNLHESMYIFIAALSVNSLLVSINIYPKLLIDFLSEKQTVSYSVCLLQYFLCYCLGIVDLLLLAAMAFDRYVSICKPLVYPNIMTNRTVVCQAESLSFCIKGFFCTNSIFKLHCVNSKVISVFGLVSCMFILGICPVFFVLFTYARILFIVYKSSNDVRQKAAETCLPHLLVLLCFTALGPDDVVFVVLYNPLFNPFIYGFKMKEIFKRLKKLRSVNGSHSLPECSPEPAGGSDVLSAQWSEGAGELSGGF